MAKVWKTEKEEKGKEEEKKEEKEEVRCFVEGEVHCHPDD